MTSAELLQKIETFLRRNKMTARSFSEQSVGYSALVTRLRKGKSINLTTADRVARFMRDHRAAKKGRG